jgi:hypothetical protein
MSDWADTTVIAMIDFVCLVGSFAIVDPVLIVNFAPTFRLTLAGNH